MIEEKYCIVQFKYNCSISPDEHPRVVGNIKELGDWDVSKSKPLVRDNYNSSIWKTKDHIQILQNSLVEYKYIVFKDNKLDRWENLPNNMNRVLNTGNFLKIVTADIQDDLNNSVEKSESNYSQQESNLKAYNIEDFAEEEDELISMYNKNVDEQHFSEPEDINDKFNNLNYESNDESDETFQLKNIQEKQSDITEQDDILMCSFYLPLNVLKNKKGEITLELTNEPLFHTVFRLIENKKNVKWFGTIKNYSSFSDSEKNDISQKFLEKNMYLIDIDKEIFNTNIELFKEILEPIFHYISLNSSIIQQFSRFDQYWEAYKEMNEKLCDTLLPYLKPNSLIYLHDYHFCLAPNILLTKWSQRQQKLIQHLSIGLFMHSPFPSHELFKRIPFREEFLKSMMNCAVIGFHTFAYSRNFLKSAKRLLSINYESTINGDLAVNYYDRAAIVRVKNATPEFDLVKADFNSEEFNKYYKELKEKCKDKCVFVSMDQLKFLSGIKIKLEGYRKFLSAIGEHGKKNMYLEYIKLNSDDFDQNGNIILDSTQKETLEKIEEIVNKIQEDFGKDAIMVVRKKVTYAERLALFASGNCFVRSSKQESFSLGIYEFLLLKHLLKEEQEVSYMISELSGVNTSLAGTIKINPFDYISIYNGFLQAYQTIYDTEKNATKQKDFQHALKSSLSKWLYSFLRDIKNTKLTNENTYYIGVGEGINFRLMKIKSDFQKLNINDISHVYNNSNRRLIFFDNEGTLLSSTSNEADFKTKGIRPSEETLSLLEDLAADEHNTVFIITGREAKLVSNWYANVKNLNLAAEYGFIYSLNNSNNKRKWIKTIKNFNNDWISHCIEILKPYTERCEGSSLEIKEASVAWRYNNCDQELGKAFANVITTELEYAIKNMNLKVINGKGYVEVKAIGIHKGHFVSFILKEQIAKEHTPDFVLCIGDDTSDEKMFRFLKNKKEEILTYANTAKLYSVTVGRKPSEADFYVDNPQEVLFLMKEFSKISKSNHS